MLLPNTCELCAHAGFVEHGHVAKFFALGCRIGTQLFEMSIKLRKQLYEFVHTFNLLKIGWYQVFDRHLVYLEFHARLAREYQCLSSYVHTVKVVAWIRLRI